MQFGHDVQSSSVRDFEVLQYKIVCFFEILRWVQFMT